MGNLRDELIKKGVVSSKKAQQIAHKDRARKNKLGRRRVAEERSAQDSARRARETSQREEDRKRESVRRDEASQHEERHALIQLMRDHARHDLRGPRRFHFVTRSQRIPFLEVNEQAARSLEHGELAICELPDTDPEQFLILPAESARRVQASAAEFVLFFETTSSAGPTRH